MYSSLDKRKVCFAHNNGTCACLFCSESPSLTTSQCVFDVDRVNGSGLTLLELAPGVTLEDVKAKTGTTFNVAENLGSME